MSESPVEYDVPPEITREFKEKMAEWTELKDVIKKVRQDVSALNSREKELKTFLSAYMVANKFAKVNCKNGSTVTQTKKKTKGSLSEKVIKKALLEFFENNQETVDNCWDIIQTHRGVRDSTSLTFRQPKKT